ncbi:MAG TPA: fibronectin type III domain-containing protein, partial [Spirochaetota bacterium]|nr:fibronectin type III domain-containing protein [Spirochaetota bacterium]
MKTKHVRFVIPVLATGIILSGCSLTDKTSISNDSTPPVITGAQSSNPVNNGVRISWATDEPATSAVRYGTGADYGSSVEIPALVTDHAVYLSGLQADTEYHYMVASSDSSGNRSESEDMVFTTTNAPAYGSAYYSQWENGLPSDTGFFPLAVWLQSPGNAANYAAIGINTYVGLWQGPTDSQLAALHSSGMNVICAQNDTGLTHQ